MITKNKHHAVAAQYLCDFCSEPVSNPLCPFCLATEIEAWLTLYPDLRKKLLPRMKNYLNQVDYSVLDSTQCIKCGNRRASVCPYCFTEFVLRELKKLEANKIILTEFFQFFNFDFDHTEYSSEAEKLGII